MNIIDVIEDLRKAKNVRKQELCDASAVNKNMYANYLKGSRISFDVAKKMLEYLGYNLIITKEYEKL